MNAFGYLRVHAGACGCLRGLRTLSFASLSAPAASSALTQSVKPLLAAQCSAVHSHCANKVEKRAQIRFEGGVTGSKLSVSGCPLTELSFASFSAPDPISALTHSRWPPSAA